MNTVQENVSLAQRLRRETTMTPSWIGQRLKMGSWTCAANLIYLAFILAGVAQLAAPAAETDGPGLAQTNERAASHLQPGAGFTKEPEYNLGTHGGLSGIAGGFVSVSKDMERSRAWTSRLLSGPASLPVSFMLDGKAVTGIPAGWGPVSNRRRIDANLIETTFEGRDAKTGLGLRVECVEYLDYPVVEWVAWLTNTGDQPTPIISDIAALDGRFDGASPVLHHNNGDFYSEKGYDEQETPLDKDVSLRFAPSGGRPCDHAFPYYRVAFKDYGLSIAIGWPAQWSAAFTGLAGGVHIRAGQEKTHLRLMPGETVRTPRMTVMSWTGDAMRAANLWRRWYRDHVLPRTNGRPLGPMSVAHGTDDGEEFTAATEKNQVQYMDLWAKRGIRFDVWWIDAGWYPCYNKEHQRRWPNTGTWEPDPERFPAGFKPVSDHAARQGADLLIWFEPERVTPGTSLDREHPDWLLESRRQRLREPPAEPGQSGLPPMADRPCVQVDPRQRHQDIPAGPQLRSAPVLAGQRCRGPAGHERKPACARLSSLLGRSAGAESGAVDRFLRIRRPAQRPGNDAPLRPAALHRLRVWQPSGEAILPSHAIPVAPLFQRGVALVGLGRPVKIRQACGQLFLPLRPRAHDHPLHRHPQGRLRLRSDEEDARHLAARGWLDA